MSATAELLGDYQHVIDDLTLVTGTRGIFDVEVDGEMLFSKHETGRHATPGEILELFTEHVGPETPRYGR